MSDIMAVIDRIRSGCVVRIQTKPDGHLYIDCDTDHSRGVTEYTAHFRHPRELPYAYRLDGLNLAKTLAKNEFDVLPPDKGQAEMAVANEE